MRREKPSKEKLIQIKQQIIDGKNYTDVGKEYGVSHNCIRKWLLSVGIEPPKKYQRGKYKYQCHNCGKIFDGYFCRKKSSGHGYHFCGKKCQYERMRRGEHLTLNDKTV